MYDGQQGDENLEVNEDLGFSHTQNEGLDDGLPAGVLDLITEGQTDLAEVAPELSYDEAVALNETIKSTAEVLYILVNRAYTGKIWLQLGYNSFKDYVATELDISRSRAYQLIDQAQVVEKISAIAPEGANIQIKEVVARDIKSVIDDLVPEIERGLAELGEDEDPSDYINSVLEDARQAQRDQGDTDADLDASSTGEFESGESYGEESSGDQADRDGFSASSMGSGGGGGSGGQSGGVYDRSIDDMLSGGGDEDLFDIDSDDAQEKLEGLYSFYTIVDNSQKLPDAERVVQWIPEDKRSAIAANIDDIEAWFVSFANHFRSQPWYAHAKENAPSDSIEEPSIDDFFSGLDSEEDGEDLF